ncbi:hypothetical protein D4R30_00410 [archaeon]|nr:MAG: hypothetical protein D4R30_00410 [archaeon]
MVDGEAALVQLKLQLESLISIARNCIATVELLQGKPAPGKPAAWAPSMYSRKLVTDQVLACIPEDLRGKVLAVKTPGGAVALSTPWLGKPDWDRLNEAVLAIGGKWIPEGKRSRWEVPLAAGDEEAS